MRIYRDFANPKYKTYLDRVTKIKVAHPDKFYDSDYYHTMLAIDMIGVKGMLDIHQACAQKLWPFVGLSNVPRDATNFATEALCQAAALGDTEFCKDLYKDLYADFNGKDEDGNNSLMYAIKRKRVGTAEWLYMQGAKILPNKYGWDPLLWAVHDGCLPALNMFYHRGVDFNQPRQIKEKNGVFLEKMNISYLYRLHLFPKNQRVFSSY